MRRIIYTILIALSLAGCAAVGDSKKTITYDKAMWKYETAIRWVDFGTANTLRRLEDTTAYTPDVKTLQHIKVTSYNLVNRVLSEDKAEAHLTVEIVYYNDSTMKLVTIIDNQIWKYDPAIKDWYITTPLPPFR